MATIMEVSQRLLGAMYEYASQMSPLSLLLLLLATAGSTFIFVLLPPPPPINQLTHHQLYAALLLVAPIPRPPFPSEKKYITTTPTGSVTEPKLLPCWLDNWEAHRNEAETGGRIQKHTGTIDAPEVEMSVVIPAYNEEDRIVIMLEECIAFCDPEYGRKPHSSKTANRNANSTGRGMGGYEILIIDDGSNDQTVEVVLEFARKHGLHDILRVVSLKQNRGKGGAVTHGFRHVRGAYAVFADADGASRFEDLRKLVEGCKSVACGEGRAIAVGSRAHLVGSEAVVKRSALRNTLMHSFHLLLRLLTPPATSRIRDTQCGFKLFSRASLPHIVPYMHAEGWIFDVEMLMLAESAPPSPSTARADSIGSKNESKGGIAVAEIPIGWKEISGSKLNVMWDSLGMAWGLAVLRASWMVGVYRRR
ncbi:related to dolichyl-phosphate beta-glucosyltransferase [Phialocephala subalpina]|uniref:dolichyl-phosphate beta-glucosyltransferase n=1 Tax=Phialocephala subalpina TaxID=576137 RepID=A0A1L7XFU5_9HELO|nr:related to dolichyl-phosphate beta-glucosyltransferase [Phialocephala subalpina]